MTLEKIAKQGILIETFPLFDRSTIQHSDELQADRVNEVKSVGLNNSQLTKQWFWTADFPLYVKEGNDVVLYFARGKDNLVFNDIDNATKQLSKDNNYFVNNKSDIESVINSDTTLKIALSDLKLEGNDSEWRYFSIDTKNYDKLNDTQRVFAERVHGEGEAFKNTMKMLSDSGIKTTRMYVLNPDYVKKKLKDSNAEGIARVSALDGFSNSSDFGADCRGVVDNLRRLRGVLKGAEGTTQKNDVYANALKTLMSDEGRDYLMNNPEATGKLYKHISPALMRMKN